MDDDTMAGTLTKEQRERRATAVRELLAAMRQAYEEDRTRRALIDAMVGCVTTRPAWTSEQIRDMRLLTRAAREQQEQKGADGE